MKRINISLVAIATLLMVSCGTETKTEESTEKTAQEAIPVEKSTEETCTYTYDAASTSIKWISFKTSAKVAVGGTFNEFTVDGTEPSNSESAVFENAYFSINTSSVNSGNEERDPKLIKFFFNTMVATETITGGIASISEAVKGKGAAVVKITMNKQSRDVNATYTLEGNVLTLSATVNMADWDASNAITVLNTECKDLHTGDDGVSKLWEEVDFEITTTLVKSCE